MRLIPVFLGIAALACSRAAAQEAKLTIQPGHGVVIQQYVTTQHIPTSVMKMRVEIGSTIPDEIQLRPVPLGLVAKVPEIRNYEYFVADGGKVVFVEPYTRMVVQILQ